MKRTSVLKAPVMIVVLAWSLMVPAQPASAERFLTITKGFGWFGGASWVRFKRARSCWIARTGAAEPL